ncbi:MAG: tyrosine-protein phosphatase [Thermoleophilia bacterium]
MLAFSRHLREDNLLEFIDTHCHIIPGVDDGSSDTDTSLAMARMAMADGITHIVATPHIVEGYYDGSDREQRLAQLRKIFASAGIDLRLSAGAEVPMSTCLAGDKTFLKSLAINGGKFLLMETAETTFDQVAEAAYRVRLCGLYPILAHPERATFVQKQPSRLDEIMERDQIYCQLTAASIEGIFGKTIKKTSLILAKSGMIHLVASDAHSAGKRAPLLSNCYKILSGELGETAARAIMLQNPSRVLESSKLERPALDPGDIPNRGHFLKLFRRKQSSDYTR